jgi:hypothetical protein
MRSSLLGGLVVILATLANARDDWRLTYGSWGFDTAGADFKVAVEFKSISEGRDVKRR